MSSIDIGCGVHKRVGTVVIDRLSHPARLFLETVPALSVECV